MDATLAGLGLRLVPEVSPEGSYGPGIPSRSIHLGFTMRVFHSGRIVDANDYVS